MLASQTVNLQLALTTALALGFRHGIDYDHLAAISDLSRLEESPRGAMRLGMLYVLGHAATITVLAAIVIFFQRSLPIGIDRWTERLVGITLLILGIYVFATLFRQQDHKHWTPSSRFLLIANAARWSAWRIQRLFGSGPSEQPDVLSWCASNTPAFTVGVIHGLGAETPTQLLLFLLAANLGGTGRGFLGLAMFLVGLIAMNTLMCASMAWLSRAGARRPLVARTITLLTAGYSVIVGAIFLVGPSSILPSLGW